MKRLQCSGAILITALALTGSAFAAEAPLSPTNAVQVQQTGVTTETKPGGFALVTFGTWHTPEVRNPIASSVAATGQLTNVRPNNLSSGSFRRAIYLPHVQAAERRYALPHGLLDALIWTESRYNPLALSKAGAAGLGQLMPSTARAVGVVNRYDPRANLGGAAQYLRQLLDQFGKIHLAVAAYNAGPGAVRDSGGIPKNAETPSYVRNVLATWQSLRP
ncbi:lytic transglycosylase domain-containing protein [Novosphingobium sp.]|uniref:lytic transglycosylase domain-containing protein n=1 Tax=Novosphingobium sp. TaxID=1874826 RepID=UPI003341E276